MHLELLQHTDPVLIDKLKLIEMECGFDLQINSATRDGAKNADVGGKPTSDHLINSATGYSNGVDLQCAESWKRFRIIKAALDCGIRRIGLYRNKNCIHLGNRASNPQDVFWLE